jgi:hypothetical protein
VDSQSGSGANLTSLSSLIRRPVVDQTRRLAFTFRANPLRLDRMTGVSAGFLDATFYSTLFHPNDANYTRLLNQLRASQMKVNGLARHPACGMDQRIRTRSIVNQVEDSGEQAQGRRGGDGG